MNEIELNYIREQLAHIKTKVDLDNQLGLFDINKLCEDIFMHMLNDVYGWSLKNANLFQENFPAIDLVDDINKIVVQVTSTTNLDKVRDTIEKFEKLTGYNEYKLIFFYIKEKPNFRKESLLELSKKGITKDDILGIEDIIKETQKSRKISMTLYKTIQQRMNNISFKFNIDSYFKKAEPHLIDITNDKFDKYLPSFENFINSDNKVLEIHAVGGSGKSHLLRHLSNVETEYIPLIFTKQINIEEDLKKLDPSKKYLFIFDDIDRFLDQPIFYSLLSYIQNNENTKLIITFRSPSKSIIQAFYRKFTQINKSEIEIVWDEEEIESLVVSLRQDFSKEKIKQIAHIFNNNPYLITQALKGDIETIKDFSKKIIDDTKKALHEFELSEAKIKDILFTLTLIVPILDRNIEKYIDKKIILIQKLEDANILRKLVSKYRFNPDILGDLYLANYIDEHQDIFEEKVEELLPIFSDTLFTNLSYALKYNDSDSLQKFIKNIITRWDREKEYRNDYLALVNKVVLYAPEESFIYLQNATKHLQPKQINTLGQDGFWSLIVTKYSPDDGDWSSDIDAINLESIEPIISKLLYALKNNIECGNLTIEHIINYLSSDIVLTLPKPYYDNQTLESIFERIVSPLDTKKFNVINTALEDISKWLKETTINYQKIHLLSEVVRSLLSATFEENRWSGMSFQLDKVSLNLQHEGIIRTIDKTKEILFSMLKIDDESIQLIGLKIITNIGGYELDRLSQEHQIFYNSIKKEALILCTELLNKTDNFNIISCIEDIFTELLRLSPLKNEALDALSKIDRTDYYLFYRLIQGSDIVIIDFKKFYDECKLQQDVREWIYQNYMHKIGKPIPTEEEWNLIEKLGAEFKNTKEIIKLMNTLNTDHWGSNSLLLMIFDRWYKQGNEYFNEVAIKHIEKINNNLIQNALKEFSLTQCLITLNLEDIDKDTSIDDLKVYINSIFNQYTPTKLDLLKKIVKIIGDKKPNDIRVFISIISQRIYFILANNHTLYDKFEPILIDFLKWQQQYKFSNESYITHHILYDIAKKDGFDISLEIKKTLSQIIKDDDIEINEFKLKSIYKVLDYGINEIVDNIYKKLIVKKEDDTYKYWFTLYSNTNNIEEVLLLKSYINSYEDFKLLVDKALPYCSKPVEVLKEDNGKEYQMYIHLNYFFKHVVTEDYIKQFFDELHEEKNINKIKLLYPIVPVSIEYVELIAKNLNLLDGTVEEDNLIDYLREIGKVKTYSGGHMQNSPELLTEEKILEEILKHVDSLSLQLKIKNELKYIEIRKREEIERDISHLLEK